MIIQLLLQSESKKSTKSIPSILPGNEEGYAGILVESCKIDLEVRDGV